MKVLLVSDFYPPDPGGLEAHVARLGAELASRRHRVVVATGSHTVPDTTAAGVSVHSVPVGGRVTKAASLDRDHVFHPPWADRAFVAGLRRIAEEFRPDVVHAHGWCEFSAASVARALALPLVVTLHDYGLLCPKRTLLRGQSVCDDGLGLRCVTCPSVEQGTAKRAALASAIAAGGSRLHRVVAHYLAVSTHVATRHVAAGLPRDRISIVPNFLTLPAAPAAALSPFPPKVLFLGGATRHKGGAVLLDAHRGRRNRDIRLVVAGGTAAKSSDPSIELRGRLEPDGVAAAYREAALVCLPSLWAEPCPTVAIEAMAWGKPIVATNLGGHRDLVEDGVTGSLVPAGDASALRDAIDHLVADPSRRLEMGRRAQERAIRFSSIRVVPAIEAAYREAAASSAPATTPDRAKAACA